MSPTISSHVPALRNPVRILAMLLAATTAQATVFVKDPAMTGGTGSYTAGASLAGQAATNGTVGVTGGTGAWGTGTGVFLVDATGLAYPDGIELEESGGSFTLKNSSSGVTEGRVLSRPINNIPTSGTLCFSILLRAEDNALSALAVGQSHGMGLGTNTASGIITARMPNDGVYFGFARDAAGRALTVNIKGTDYTLLENPSSNTTYFCVAKIELGAGAGGTDRISAQLDPAYPDDFGVVVETNLFASGATFSRLRVAGAYGTANKRVFFDEPRVGDTWADVAPFPAGFPAFADEPTVSVDGTGNFVFSATLIAGTEDTAVIACCGDERGDVSAASWDLTKLVTATPTLGAPSTTVLDSLATNTCYYFAALATNASASVVRQGGTLLNGEVWITAGDNASEDGFVAGTFVVHRPPSATQTPLTVAYTVSGTAVSGQNYTADSLPGSVSIAAGQDSATIVVAPLFDTATAADTTVTLTLSAGPYYVGADDEATIVVENLDLPADKNVWIAPTAGNASVAANWSQGVPQTDDDILLDLFSTVNMTWDAGVNGLPDTVGSWTQTTAYVGTVTFPITFPSVSTTFTNFVIGGDCAVAGGTWRHETHATTYRSDRYRLVVRVGGDFALGAAAGITGTAIGPWVVAGSNYNLPTHGGNTATHLRDPYDNIRTPELGGTGGSNGTDSDSKRGNGGGAILVFVAGDATLDGLVQADGGVASMGCGSGGTVRIEATNIAGSGTIRANGSAGTKTDSGAPSGAGGRVALVARETMTLADSQLGAFGYYKHASASAGTIYTASSALPGRILVNNRNPYNVTKTIPDKTFIPVVTDTDDWSRAATSGFVLDGVNNANLSATRDLAFASVTLDASSKLELAGNEIRAAALFLGGAKVPTGIYAAGASELGAYVTDSAGTGLVIVGVAPTLILLR